MKGLKLLVVILCVAVTNVLLAQKDSTKEVDLLLNTAQDYIEEYEEFNRADSLAQIALDLSIANNYQEGVCESQEILGRIAKNKGNLDKAYKNYIQSLTCYQRTSNRNKEARVLLILSQIEGERVEYEKQIVFAKKALAIYNSTNDLKGQANAFLDLGNGYVNQENPDSANYFFNQAAISFIEQGDSLNWAIAQYGIARTYYESDNNLSYAIELLGPVSNIFEKEGELNFSAQSLNVLGAIFYGESEYEKAEHSFLKSLDLAKKSEDNYLMFDALVNLGELSVYEGEIKKAKDYANQAANLLGEDEISKYDAMYLGRLQDSISGLEGWLESERVKIYSIVGGVSFIVFIGSLFYFFNKKSALNQQRYKTDLEIKELRHEKKVDGLIQEIVQSRAIGQMKGEAKERKRIAQLVHNTVASQIAGTRWSLEPIISNLEAKGYATDELKSVNNMLQEAYRNARNIERHLENNRVDWLKEIDKFYARIKKVKNIDIKYIKHGLDDDLSSLDEIGSNIYQIILTLTTNVLVHAKANELKCQLNLIDEGLNIILEDDGRGFDPKRQYDGNGLKNVRKIVKDINGEIEIASIIGQGTTIVIAIPNQSKNS